MGARRRPAPFRLLAHRARLRLVAVHAPLALRRLRARGAAALLGYRAAPRRPGGGSSGGPRRRDVVVLARLRDIRPHVHAVRLRSGARDRPLPRRQREAHRALGVRGCRRGLAAARDSSLRRFPGHGRSGRGAVALARPSVPPRHPDARGRPGHDPVRHCRPAPGRPLRRRPGRRGVDRRADRRLGPTRPRFLGDGRRRRDLGRPLHRRHDDRAGTARPSERRRSSRSA